MLLIPFNYPLGIFKKTEKKCHSHLMLSWQHYDLNFVPGDKVIYGSKGTQNVRKGLIMWQIVLSVIMYYVY